jgi:hypothetical protein
VLVGLGQQFDAMALERGDDFCPHPAADVFHRVCPHLPTL